MGYAIDQTLSVKLLPRSSVGMVDIDDAIAMTITTTSRAYKPYPPGNVRINGFDYANWPTATTGDVTLTWSNRSRVGQGTGTQLIAQSVSNSYALEGSITVEVLIDGIVKRTWSGVITLSQVYTSAQHWEDDPTLAKPVQFRITPIYGTFIGNVRTTPTFLMGA